MTLKILILELIDELSDFLILLFLQIQHYQIKHKLWLLILRLDQVLHQDLFCVELALVTVHKNQVRKQLPNSMDSAIIFNLLHPWEEQRLLILICIDDVFGVLIAVIAIQISVIGKKLNIIALVFVHLLVLYLTLRLEVFNSLFIIFEHLCTNS